MKHILLVMALIALVALVGCAAPAEQQAEVVDDDMPAMDDDAVEMDDEPDMMDTMDDDKEVMGLDNVEKLEGILKIGDYFKIMPTNKKLEVGDTYAFAHGITNPGLDQLNVQQTVEFVEARDTYMNPIQQADADTIMRWLDSERVSVVSVDRNGMEVVTIQFTVGDEIAPGVDTMKATYVFRILNHNADQLEGGSPKLYGITDFSIRVD